MNKQEHKKAAMDEALKEIKKCKETHSLSLEIGYNGYLDIFPEEIMELTWLKYLSVICTAIKLVPNWIVEMTNLYSLDLRSNQKLQKLPIVIANLKKLKILILGNTGCTNIVIS
jgi:Leucine-rich repeat (LRR) protein